MAAFEPSGVFFLELLVAVVVDFLETSVCPELGSDEATAGSSGVVVSGVPKADVSSTVGEGRVESEPGATGAGDRVRTT